VGTASELQYGHHRANAFQRTMQAFGSTRGGAWFFSKTLAPIDRLLHRATKGRTSLPAVLAGLPVIMVTTTGRKSGVPRTTPLISVPIDDDLALLGTNFGQPGTPAWVFNLEADPHATVEHRGVERAVVARPATDDERATVWEASSGVYGGYVKYQQRVTSREIRIFVLEPANTSS
jgi:deazaflavin-dependent oxidoreductase (nitroreductase family)